MKNVKRKLIGSGIVTICALTAVAGGSKVSQKAAEDAFPVSAAKFESTPVIILDAGHGAST